MQAKISPSQISGELKAPASKSSMQRACAAALLHTGTTQIKNPGISNDDKTALNIITEFGAVSKFSNGTLTIISPGFPADISGIIKIINCGESGLSVRMFTPIAALSSEKIILVGEGSLQNRPMDFFDKILPQLGVEIKSDNGRLPLELKGPLKPVNISVDGSLSSQFLTGLLFAFGASVKTPVTISVRNLTSKPYIDLTIDVMKNFGFNICNENYKDFIIGPKNNLVNTVFNYTVEGDWSSTSFLLVAGAIAGAVRISGLDEKSSQADKAIISVLQNCGAEVIISDDLIEVRKKALKAFMFDATDCPDLFPPLVALAAYCNGNSVIKGIHRLAAKESNRAETLKEVFGLMGIDILLENDEMIIQGGGPLRSANISSHNDHRIAMAGAIAALGAQGAILISHAEAINKSYPDFFDDLKKIGAALEITEP